MNVDLIRSTPLFAGLTTAEQALVAEHCRQAAYERGTKIFNTVETSAVLYRAGERPQGLFLLEGGALALEPDDDADPVRHVQLLKQA